MFSIFIFLSTLLNVNVAIETPANFYGSPEIFSGYLPNRDRYIDAFTLYDCLAVDGTATQISGAIPLLVSKGMFDTKYVIAN